MTYVKAFFRRLYQIAVQYPLAVAATVCVVVAFVLLKMYGRSFDIGGMLGKLWGKSPTPGVRTAVVAARSAHGKLLTPGSPDERGYVQAPVTTEILQPGAFSNPDTITVVHPDKGEITILLPTGVKNKDVQEVVEIEPGVYEIKNNDSGVDTDDVRNALR